VIDPREPDYTNTPGSAARACFDYAPADPAAPPCLSIVTPFYNTGAIFHETARSVFGQSLQQWEWIIVNDGSTEHAALAILDGYRRRDPRVRVVDHATNRGLSATRNSGFAAATADYVLQLDSDDLLEPTAAEKWWWCLESNPEYAFAKGYHVGFGAREYLWPGGFHETTAFLEFNQADATSLIRRSVHTRVGGYDGENRAGLEDWDFWLRCADQGYWGATVPELLGWYRQRDASARGWTNWDRPAAAAMFRDQLRERYRGLWEGRFPDPRPRPHVANAVVRTDIPAANRLVKRRPRLLLIVPWLVMGGAERVNLSLIEGLTRRGWEVTIAATSHADHPWLPLFTRLSPDTFVLERFLHATDYPRFLRYLVESRDPDVVMVANSELGYHLVPFLRAYAPRTAFVDFTHAVEDWKNGSFPRMAVELGPLLDANITASSHVADWIVAQGGDRDRVRVCHVNVDTTALRPDAELRRRTRAQLEVPDDVPVILIAARIAPEKQPRVMARVLKQLLERQCAFAAVVAGDGPELPWLQGAIAEDGLSDRVRLTSRVAPERIHELMAAADVFFLPSQREGISLACFEAMSCGLAVVAADVGGQRELITPLTGVLVARGSEDEEVERYALVLERLLCDPEARGALGARAREHVATRFDVRQFHDRMAQELHVAAERARARQLVVSPALAAVIASHAVEFSRLSAVAEAAWAAGERSSPPVSEVWPVAELRRTNRWLEEQRAVWEKIARDREALLLQAAPDKAWLEEQRSTWERIAREREAMLLQAGADKAWLEEQRQVWENAANQRAAMIADLKQWIETIEGRVRGMTATNASVVDAVHSAGAAWRAERERGWLGLRAMIRRLRNVETPR
jgi:glycosyltransferase involved in cell wall biosynthesis